MIGIRSAISIRARGHRPHLEAVYMTAPRSACRNTKKALAERGPSIHDGEGGAGSARLSDHQHIEHNDRRQGQDHRPDAQRPEDVLGGKTLLFREWVIFRIHDAPAFLAVAGYRYASNFKKPVAISRAFDHRCYRGLTTGAPPEARQLPIRRPVPRLNQGSLRVPDAVQPSHGDAEHRPVTLFRM